MSHVHGVVIATPLSFPLQVLLPHVSHALRKVGGRCGWHGNVCPGRKPGVVDWCRGSALIPQAVDGDEEPDWRSGVATSMGKSQPPAPLTYKKGCGAGRFFTHPTPSFPLAVILYRGERPGCGCVPVVVTRTSARQHLPPLAEEAGAELVARGGGRG